MAWTSPKTWNTNDVLSAADLNTYIRDNENAISRLSSYTPTWTASTTNPTIGNGRLEGRYILLEEWCWVQVFLTMGTTSTGGSGQYQFTLPTAGATLSGGAEQALVGSINDLGVARYICVAAVLSGSTVFSVNGPGPWPSGGANQAWTATSPFTFGNQDTFNISGIYRRV